MFFILRLGVVYTVLYCLGCSGFYWFFVFFVGFFWFGALFLFMVCFVGCGGFLCGFVVRLRADFLFFACFSF